MKLKHVFFSGLLLSVGFTACTNEDFTEMSAPVNTQEAVALGENYTIRVAKTGADTKAVFNEDLDPVWVEGDKLGAAWVHMITGHSEEDGSVNSVLAFNNNKFYSNHPFELTKGAGTQYGEFTTVTNAFAGAYALYYPYDPTVAMTGDEIPVSIKSYEFDGSDVTKNINLNMFNYAPVKFLQGGNQTEEFNLEPVPVLFQVWFKPGKVLNMDLTGGLEIKNIVIMAGTSTNANGDAAGSSLYTEGKVVPTAKAAALTPARYNDEEDMLTDILEYQGTTPADHLFITTTNCNTDDYKLLENEVATKKPFIFSTLPINKNATVYTIKVVTDKGVYKRTYNAATPADKAIIDELKNAWNEGGQVSIGVELNLTEDDAIIYTAEEFVNRWNDAIAAGKDAAELVIGTDLTLEEGLVCGDANAQFTVSGHKLTVPSLDLTSTSTVGVTFDCPLVVEGKLFTSGDSQLTANELTAAEVEIQGDADLKVAEVETMTIGTSGVVSVEGIAGEESVIGKITNRGQLTPNTTDLTIKELDSKVGALTLTEGYTNNGTMTLGNVTVGSGKSFENNGAVVLNGELEGTFNNNAGATLTINANQTKMTLDNKAADATKKLPAAVVNISAGKTLTAATSYSVENEGIINVYGNLMENDDQALTQTAADARIIAKSNEAEITMASSNTNKLQSGYVMILVDANIVNGTGEPTAYDLTDSEATIPTVGTIFVNTNIDSNWLTANASKNLILNTCNIEFDNSANVTMTGSFTVAGNVTVSLAQDATSATLNLADVAGNGINKGASLTLCEGFTFTYKTGKWDAKGTFNPNGATVTPQA